MTFEGVVSSSDLRRAVDEFFGGVTHGARVYSLADLSGVTRWDVGVDDLRSAAAVVSKNLKSLGGVRCAIVATTAEAFGMSRMFELTLQVVVGVDIRVFRSRSEAEQWLGVAKR